jgi:hypothetical protein
MASLKSFLSGVAPILEVTPAALYERQRALVSLGVLEPIEGRGRGSGVPFTADNFAAVLISMLATDSLSEVDERVVHLINAIPGGAVTIGPARMRWQKLGKPTFLTEVGRVLAGKNTIWRHSESSRQRHFYAIRVTRPGTGQIIDSPSGASPIFYTPANLDALLSITRPGITLTAAVEYEGLVKLIAFTSGALSQLTEEEDEE